jgi:hypothetical protein
MNRRAIRRTVLALDVQWGCMSPIIIICLHRNSSDWTLLIGNMSRFLARIKFRLMLLQRAKWQIKSTFFYQNVLHAVSNHCNGRFCLLNEIKGSKQWFNYSNLYLLSKIAVIWIEERTRQIVKEHFHYSLIWYFCCREMGRHHGIYRASELSMRSSSFRMCQVVYFGSKVKIMAAIIIKYQPIYLQILIEFYL